MQSKHSRGKLRFATPGRVVAVSAALLAAVINSLYVGALVWPTSSGGLSGVDPLWVLVPLVLCLFLVAAVGLSSALLAAFGAFRPASSLMGIGGAVYTVVGVGVLFSAERMRILAFAQLAERSMPLVAAVTEFVEDNGRPPKDWEEVVPDYYPELPKTGMGAYPEYVLTSGDDDWGIYVLAPCLGWDMFVYNSNEVYDETQGYELVGRWAYLHE